MKTQKPLSAILNCQNKNYDFSDVYASFGLPFTTKFLQESKEMVEKFHNFQNIAVIGIGGSNL